MKFGFENEYFLRRDSGHILEQVDHTLPRDAHGVLVEVRSDPFENPYQVLASFNAKYAELEEACKKLDCFLHNIQQHALNGGAGRTETAGFHIHFSKDEWTGMNQFAPYPNDPPTDVQVLCKILDTRFKSHYENLTRHPHWWRAKPYGWEWRRLPATINPLLVAQVLAEEFYVEPLKVAA